MKLPFRQGIVDAQKNGLGQPQFILLSSTPGYVQLSATTTATTINVAHGSSDYLFTFNQNVDPAWGPMVPGVNNYLYWNADIQTAAISYGVTTLEPIISATEPVAPQVDQHWFDLASTIMKVWNGSKWQIKIRLFAGMIPNGNLASDQTTWCYPLYQPWALATELMVESNPGYVMANMFGQPLYLNGTTLEFLTSKTEVRINSTVGTSGVLSQPTNAIFPVKAGENIPPMSVVYFSGSDQVGLASGNPAVDPPKIPVGIVQCELAPGEIGILHQSGEISCDSWDWSASIGKPLYCGDYGTIVTHRPAGLLAYRVGFAKNRNTIVFHVDAETLPQIYEAGPSDVVINADEPMQSSFIVNGLGERVWTLSMPASTPAVDGFMSAAQAAAVEDHETRLDQAELDIANRSLLGHVHTIANVTGLQTALDSKSPVGHTHIEYSPISHIHAEYAPVVHSHTIPDVAGLQVELNGKAPTIHTHVMADVTDLAAALDTKIDKVPAAAVGNFAAFTTGGGVVDSTVSLTSLSTTFAFANHTHSIAHVSGLQTALDGKAAVTHNHDTQYSPIGHQHALDELTDVDTSTNTAFLGDALVWNGSLWVPGTVVTNPALLTEVVQLGSSAVTSTFTLRTTEPEMQYWSTYLADQAGYLQPLGGAFDETSTAGEPTVVYPTPKDFLFDGLGISIAAIGNTATTAPETAFEVVINAVSSESYHQFFVGYFFPVIPFDTFDIYGGPGGAVYWSTSVQSGTQGYGGVGDVSGLPPWVPGDVIGLIVKDGSVMRLFRNGVFVTEIGVISSPGGYVMVGGYTLS